MNDDGDNVPQWLQDGLKESAASLRRSRVKLFGEEGADAWEQLEEKYGLPFTAFALLKLVGDVVAKRLPRSRSGIKQWWKRAFWDAARCKLINVTLPERIDVECLPKLSAIALTTQTCKIGEEKKQ